MTVDQDQILAAALALPAVQRARVAEQLLKSLDGVDQGEIDTAWAAEAERRINRLDRGEARALDGDNVLNGLKTIAGR